MPFDIKNTNPAERFYYPNYAEAMEMPEDKREWVELRLCLGQPLKDIEKKTDVNKVEHVQPLKKNGKVNLRAALQRIEYVKRDFDLYNELTFDHIIYNWRLLDSNGNEIPINLENKLIMLGIFEFDRFTAECLESMTEADRKSKEDQESNLSSTAKESRESQIAEPAGKHLKHTEKNPTAKTVSTS